VAIAVGQNPTCVYLNERGQIVIGDALDQYGFVCIDPQDLGDLIGILQKFKDEVV
jgi:hypothetical protein